nr:hypothetical protein [Tanacetum cinerariifolium]
MRIGDGEKDSLAASEFAETNSFSGRGEELSYNNFSIRRMSSLKSQSVSSIPGEIDLRRVSSPANLSKRESILDEIGREESWSTVELNLRIKIVIMSIEDRMID